MSREYRPKTPAPLKTSQTPNISSGGPASYPFLADSPSHFLAPKSGAPKLKVKAGISPEARPRAGGVVAGAGAGLGLGGLRPVTPRPIKSRLQPQPDVRSGLGSSRLGRAITPSESEESLNVYNLDVGEMDTGAEEVLGKNETVLVSVRVRPPGGDDEVVWGTDQFNPQSIRLGKGQAREEREWTFDRILDPSTDNKRAYAMSAKTHVRRAMEGYNALIFAYGQTASGKTHTLSGSPSAPGIIPLAIHDLFAQIRATPDREYLLRASYLELYNETLLDLLSGDGRELSLSEGRKKGEVVVNGLTECAVRTEDEVRRLLSVGEDSRKVGKTDWNARSSRSHCVFRLSRASRSELATPGKAGDKTTRISTLSIIDLAGSERHTSSKERNAEGKHINQSLLTLKLVISKLADMASKRNVTHVPYRDSKLTRLLQPSLAGDALISVICTLSPSAVNLNESLSTLSFAQGLKRVLLRAERKEVIDSQALIQRYQEEIAELKSMLRNQEGPKVEQGKGRDMELRLEELKSLILTGGSSQRGTIREARPLSPTKLSGTLGYDRSAAKVSASMGDADELREDLHAAELKISRLTDDKVRLQYELDARPSKPNERMMELLDEVAGLKMIAEDYERNLLEPSRKVREDVEREWASKVEKLEQQLESKQIWACRLDEQVRALTAENEIMRGRCAESEQKVHLIMDWLNTTLSSDPNRPERADAASVRRAHGYGHGRVASVDIPELVVEGPPGDDFGPSPSVGSGGRTTLTLNARMTRDKISHMDLASLSEKFGSLGVRARGGNVRMLREESGWDLSNVGEGLEDDDVF